MAEQINDGKAKYGERIGPPGLQDSDRVFEGWGGWESAILRCMDKRK